METEYGIRWQEAAKNGSVVTKEKIFTDSNKRDAYAEKLESKENFIAFVAWLN